MTEHPILFSCEMIRAILDGRKAQTRRVIKPQPDGRTNSIDWNTCNLAWVPWNWNKGPGCGGSRTGHPFNCPYGKLGDRLWVREKMTCIRELDTGGAYFDTVFGDKYEDTHLDNYRAASGNSDERWLHEEWLMEYKNWYSAGVDRQTIPAIHMPRWASRILLEVTDVRVEKVQEISEGDCEAEGLKVLQGGIKSEFRVLWDSINKKRGFGWAKNPWCWCVSFKRIKP